MKTEMYTTEDLAGMFSISTRRVREIAQTWQLGSRPGRDLIFSEQDVAWLRQHRAESKRIKNKRTEESVPNALGVK